MEIENIKKVRWRKGENILIGRLSFYGKFRKRFNHFLKYSVKWGCHGSKNVRIFSWEKWTSQKDSIKNQ